MDPNFRLIKLVDPSKSATKIKDRFAKLTLSSHKKRELAAQQAQETEDKPVSYKSVSSRKLFDDVLTDDDSDTEADALNRIFRSKTTAKASDNGAKEAPECIPPQRQSKSFSQRLQMSDSDETNCTLEESPKLVRQRSEVMERLEVSPSQPQERKTSSKLLPSSTAVDEDDLPLHQISARLSSLDIKERTAPVTSSSGGDRRVKDAALENILKKHVEMKKEQIDSSPINRRISIFTISSSETSPISVNGHHALDGSDVVIISESEDEETHDDSYPVSSMRPTNEPSVISDTMRDRLDAFFENIPSLASNEGPEKIFADKGVMDKSDDRSFQPEESVPEESIEVSETASESEKPGEADQISDACLEEGKSVLLSKTEEFLVKTETPHRVCAQSPRKPRTPRKWESPKQDAKQATPKKPRTPRTLVMTPKIEGSPKVVTPRAQKAQVPARKPRTPCKAITPKNIASRASPRKAQTPRKTPTPKARKKTEPPPPSPPQSNSKPSEEARVISERDEGIQAPTLSVRPSDGGGSSSPEYRIERINISATIKIRLQFNDDVLASVESSPLVSTPSSKLPRLTESENTSENPTAQTVEEDVRTPENLKQRSIRDQNTLTTIDITKSSLINQSLVCKEPENIEKHSEEPEQEELTLEHRVDSEEPCKDQSLSQAYSTPKFKEPFSSIDECPPPLNTSDAKESSEAPIESTPLRPVLTLPEKSPDDDAALELDVTAQKLLDQLYGDEWKTPAVVKSLKKANISRFGNKERGQADESLMDFTKFHKDIKRDLESTRVAAAIDLTAETPQKAFKIPSTERRVGKPKRQVNVQSASERKAIRRDKAIKPIQRARAICVSDSSDSDINASSDESWKNTSSDDSSSDDDYIVEPIVPPKSRKNITKKTNKKKSPQGSIVYLDLSTDVVKVQHEANESPCANQDVAFQERLKDLLDTFKCPDKKKLEATPRNGNIKRKLFTPRFGEEDEALPVIPTRSEVKPLDVDDGIVTINAPLPQIFEPINKHLESVKTGKPIFALTTPKANKKNKENQPIGNVETPRTQSRKALQKAETNTLLSTPCDKYGFLQSLDVTVAKKFCHPDALKYRDNYKANKQELAEKLYEMYNENVFNGELDVGLVWNKKLLNTAGRCSCSKKAGKRFCRVELSDKVLTSADRLRCTLIHELCHAATWLYNGEHGHGATWKKWARRANGVFPELPKIGVCHDYDIDYKYTYKCTLCNAKSHAHSKSKKVENIRCAYCHGAIEVFLNKKDKDGNVLPTPVREPTGFAKFVKDNYKKHKRPDLKHADVMRLLSNEFATLNVDEKNK